jgi:hypothetical protein
MSVVFYMTAITAEFRVRERTCTHQKCHNNGEGERHCLLELVPYANWISCKGRARLGHGGTQAAAES